GNAVMVHFLTAVGGDKSVFVLSLEHGADSLLNGFAVAPLARNVAGGQEGHDAQAGGGGVGAAALSRPAAVSELRALQKGEGAVHGLIKGGVHGRRVGRARETPRDDD